MTEFAQLLEKFGIPYGVLLAAIVALWREWRRERTLNEALHDRLEKRAPEPVPDKRLDEIVSSAARMEEAVRKLLARTRRAPTNTDSNGQTSTGAGG